MGYLDELDEITTVLLTRKQERELKIRAKGTNDDKVGIRKAEVWRWIKKSQAKDWRGLLEFEDVREVTIRASRVG